MEKTTTLSAAVESESSTLLSMGPMQRRVKKKKQPGPSVSAANINYRGVNIYQAAAQGSLPVCVLLWGMASAKRVNLMTPDSQGNNPLHMAALADTAEVVNFLLQQTRGYLSEEIKLVDSRNSMGETPLMRSMAAGNFTVAKALIDEGSDPLATDGQGNSVFTLMAKSGHIWCLNSIYHTICNMHGTQVALELMCTLDNEAHSALDWAADFGDVNVLEFFVRKGLNPFRVDAMGRTALYWAVKSNRYEAARFLLKCGCDPLQKDFKEQTPLSLARKNGFFDIYLLLNGQTATRKDLPDNAINSIHCVDPASTPRLYHQIHNEKKSHSIYLHNRSSSALAVLYALLFFVVWVIAAVVPFFVWAVLSGLLVYLYRRPLSPEPAAAQFPRYRTFVIAVNKFLCAEEKGLGFWLGTMAVYLIYLWTCFWDPHSNAPNSLDEALERPNFGNPLALRGVDASVEDYELFWVNVGLTGLAVATWLKFMLLDTDPGIINTRESDFEEVLAQSLLTNGPPPSAQYCRTTFVKKPLRSKYCRQIGCVVARMDHYCIWLNLTIGFKNHRSFLLLLLCNFLAVASASAMIIRSLVRELNHGESCSFVGQLFARDFFLVAVLAVLTSLAGLGTGALLYVQVGNICSNITVNERINRARYFYLNDHEGKPSRNRFDRGALANLMEFLRVPGFDVDYTTLCDLPPELTQENMRLNEQRHSHHFFVNNSGLNALFGTQSVSGTPSLDLEMAARHRAESTDSGETFSAEVIV